jgi:tetratricopeptide (TPR) repeat protein
VTVGEALRRWGRHAQARERLTAAVAVLRDDPDTDTVRALGGLAALEVLAGTPEADDLSAEALALGQDLAADDASLADLFTFRGLWHTSVGRRPEAAAYFREAARLATQADDTTAFGRALLNLSDAITGTDPAAGSEAARTAVTHLRRAGARNHLAVAVTNLAHALLMTGDWDGAETELARTTDGDGLGDIEFLACYQAWLLSLRGDTSAAKSILVGLGYLRASEDPQDQAFVAVTEAFTAAADRQAAAALGCARAALSHAAAMGISADMLLWAWPLAARAAHELADIETTSELLALLDGYRPGQLAPMLRAERDLVRARQTAAADGEPAGAAAFTAAVAALRQKSTPYHLAHGLLDHAEHLLRVGDDEAARAAIGEALEIAQRLRCQPLIDRVESMTAAEPRVLA